MFQVIRLSNGEVNIVSLLTKRPNRSLLPQWPYTDGECHRLTLFSRLIYTCMVIVDILWICLRHIPSGTQFSLKPEGTTAELKLNTVVGIDLANEPKGVEMILMPSGPRNSHRRPSSAMMLIRNNKQASALSCVLRCRSTWEQLKTYQVMSGSSFCRWRLLATGLVFPSGARFILDSSTISMSLRRLQLYAHSLFYPSSHSQLLRHRYPGQSCE